MPPKATSKPLRGPGRPTRAAAPAPTATPIATSPSAKRGRPAKAAAVESADEPPKKRGRPAKARVEEPAAISVINAPRRGRRSLAAPERVQEAVVPKRRAGRPRTEHLRVEEVLVHKKSRGRPRKDVAVAVKTPVTPKRGRPARTTALDPGRTVRSARVANPSVLPRLDPRIRSRLRTRLAPAPAPKSHTEEPRRAPAKRGRPRKAAVQVPTAPPNKAAGRKATKIAIAKPVAPRKRRGYTTREIPDKFLAQVDQYLQTLLRTSSPDAADEVVDEDDQVVAVEEIEDDYVVVHHMTAEVNEEVGVSSPEQDQHESTDNAINDDNGQRGHVHDQHTSALASQNDMSKDQTPGPSDPVQEVEMKLNIREVVQVETAEGTVSPSVQVIDQSLIIHNDGPIDPQPPPRNQRISPAHEPPMPFVSAMLG
ncbi:hypothetical protein BKA66DRAFT_447307 [Pyrenochaeta sp. MPI-SDFR-AT-0127]|nr:hypothetical protein BKA66DRAFT_447307 [Pyrenochaeta sp. MPI-SDFR-AT-0127]